MAILRLCLAVVFCGQVFCASSVIEKPVFLSNEHANSFLRKKRAGFLWGTTTAEEKREDNIEWREELKEAHEWFRESAMELPSMDDEEYDEWVEEAKEVITNSGRNKIIWKRRLPKKANTLSNVTSGYLDRVNVFLGTTGQCNGLCSGQCIWDKLKNILTNVVDNYNIDKLRHLCVSLAHSFSCFSTKLPTSSVKMEGEQLKTVWHAFIPIFRYDLTDVTGTEASLRTEVPLETFVSVIENYCLANRSRCGDSVKKMINETKTESAEVKLKRELRGIYNNIIKAVNDSTDTIEDYRTIINLIKSVIEKEEKVKVIIDKELPMIGDVEERNARKNQSETLGMLINEYNRQVDKLNIILQGKLVYKARAEGNVADEIAALISMKDSAIRQRDRAYAAGELDIGADLDKLIATIDDHIRVLEIK